MQKQGIKVPLTRRINIPVPPERSRPDPGLHLFRTQISVVGTPGSQAALKAVFDKRKACLDEKRSRFNSCPDNSTERIGQSEKYDYLSLVN